jgi:hypothetical protein
MLIRVSRLSYINLYGTLRREPDVIINTDYISELQQFQGVARFLFLEQPEDRRRARKHQLHTIQDSGAIRDAMNTPYVDNIVSLDVFPHNDITKPTYRTHYQIKEIVKIYPYDADRSKSWILMNLKGVKLERLLVDNYWLDFITLAKTGSTSTTTSSTSTTSSSSTSTTCTPTTSSTSTSSSTTTTIP